MFIIVICAHMYNQVMLIETRKDMESATFVTVLVGLVMGVAMVKSPPHPCFPQTQLLCLLLFWCYLLYAIEPCYITK